MSLEPLEDRLTPVAFNDFYWAPPAGSDGRASTANNWLRNDSLTAGRHTLPPGPGSRTFFDGDLSSADCWFDALAGTTGGGPPPPGGYPDPDWLGGLLVRDGYAGVVDMDLSLKIGEVLMASGPAAVIQTDPSHTSVVTDPHGGTLTVTGTLLWTGGALNAGPSATHAAYINLAPGATGVAEPSFTDPAVNGTVKLGSDLILQGAIATGTGSTLTMHDGDYEIDNGAGLRATQFCNLNLVPFKSPLEGEIVVKGKQRTQNEKGLIEIEAGATARVKPVSRPATVTKWAEVRLTGPSPIYRNKGQTIIEDHTNLFIAPDGANDMGWYHQTADLGAEQMPMTRLEGGSRIECSQKGSPGFGYVSILKGQLALSFEQDGTGEPKATQRPAEIVVPTTSTAPALYVSVEAKLTTTRSTVFCTLDVAGEIKCNGEINLFVDRSALRNDRINATKAITLKANQGTTLKVSWCDPDAGPAIEELNGQQTNVYTLLHSDDLNVGISDPPDAYYPSDSTVTITGGRRTGDREWAAWRQNT